MTFGLLDLILIIVGIFAIVWLFPVPLPKRIARRVITGIDTTSSGIRRLEYYLLGTLRHSSVAKGLEGALCQKYKDHKDREWIEARIVKLRGPISDYFHLLQALQKALLSHLFHLTSLWTEGQLVPLCYEVTDPKIGFVYAQALRQKVDHLPLSHGEMKGLVSSEVDTHIQVAVTEIILKQPGTFETSDLQNIFWTLFEEGKKNPHSGVLFKALRGTAEVLLERGDLGGVDKIRMFDKCVWLRQDVHFHVDSFAAEDIISIWNSLDNQDLKMILVTSCASRVRGGELTVAVLRKLAMKEQSGTTYNVLNSLIKGLGMDPVDSKPIPA